MTDPIYSILETQCNNELRRFECAIMSGSEKIIEERRIAAKNVLEELQSLITSSSLDLTTAYNLRAQKYCDLVNAAKKINGGAQ